VIAGETAGVGFCAVAIVTPTVTANKHRSGRLVFIARDSAGANRHGARGVGREPDEPIRSARMRAVNLRVEACDWVERLDLKSLGWM
jgi:hypothetical protein